MDRALYCFRFGSAEFDESRFELKVAGLPVEVERRALEVLSCLLRHAGEVVTKEELFREVWAGRVTVDKVLPNAVTKLRRALGEANAEHITTQARIGYRLEGPVTRVAVGRPPAATLELRAGDPVPGRPNFVLRRPLGAHRGSEVWLAEHAKTREPRVYKFALDGERLRSLKREATLLRVLQDSEVDPAHFAALIDWNFSEPPFFLECEYGGLDLQSWCERHLGSLSREARIDLFLQIADAVAAAHAVGVLHKDLKPANVLVQGEGAAARLRLTDFGSGRMLDPERLQQLGITRMGLTLTENLGADSQSGTLLYLAPEVFAGQTPTARSDVYALGVLLYQLLSERLRQPMAPGWEQAIDDPLLGEDLQHATHGDPRQRLPSAAELAARLRALPQRRAQLALAERGEREARLASAALARARARRPFVWALLAALALGFGTAVVLQQRTEQARREAEAQLARANAVTRFLSEDLISRANPLVLARGAEAPLRDVLLSARERLASRFANQPLAEASVRASLAGLFAALDAWQEGEQEATRAVALFDRELGASSAESVRARALRVHLLTRLARFDEAEAELAALEAVADSKDAGHRHALAKARSSYHFNRNAFAQAVPELREALANVGLAEPGNEALRDSLRVDLVVALIYSGAHAEARAVAEALIAEAETRSGDHRLLVALTQVAAARAYSELDKGARAEAMLLAAQPVIVERLGDAHSRHLGLLNELMAVHYGRRDWARALPYAETVYQRIRARLGDAHNMTQVSRGNLGRLLYEMGRPEDAAAELRPAHAALAAALGGDAPQAQDLAFVRACVEVELGHGGAARDLIGTLDVDALAGQRSREHWQHSLAALRGLLAETEGDREGARALLAAALPPLLEGAEGDSSRLLRRAREALQRLQGEG
ncbi:protein kinase domain-containing protein [Aquimonas voraii]|nr:winged helix-turn-helix domain-containing protein [Aquimonas voraii]